MKFEESTDSNSLLSQSFNSKNAAMHQQHCSSVVTGDYVAVPQRAEVILHSGSLLNAATANCHQLFDEGTDNSNGCAKAQPTRCPFNAITVDHNNNNNNNTVDGNVLPSRIDLKRPDLKGTFRCTVCQKTFCHSSSLSRHRMQAHFKSYTCTVCQRQVKSSDSMRAHMHRQHHVQRAFICRCCNFAFAEKSALNAHLQAKMASKGLARRKLMSNESENIRLKGKFTEKLLSSGSEAGKVDVNYSQTTFFLPSSIPTTVASAPTNSELNFSVAQSQPQPCPTQLNSVEVLRAALLAIGTQRKNGIYQQQQEQQQLYYQQQQQMNNENPHDENQYQRDYSSNENFANQSEHNKESLFGNNTETTTTSNSLLSFIPKPTPLLFVVPETTNVYNKIQIDINNNLNNNNLDNVDNLNNNNNNSTDNYNNNRAVNEAVCCDDSQQMSVTATIQDASNWQGFSKVQNDLQVFEQNSLTAFAKRKSKKECQFTPISPAVPRENEEDAEESQIEYNIKISENAETQLNDHQFIDAIAVANIDRTENKEDTNNQSLQNQANTNLQNNANLKLVEMCEEAAANAILDLSKSTIKNSTNTVICNGNKTEYYSLSQFNSTTNDVNNCFDIDCTENNCNNNNNNKNDIKNDITVTNSANCGRSTIIISDDHSDTVSSAFSSLTNSPIDLRNRNDRISKSTVENKNYNYGKDRQSYDGSTIASPIRATTVAESTAHEILPSMPDESSCSVVRSLLGRCGQLELCNIGLQNELTQMKKCAQNFENELETLRYRTGFLQYRLLECREKALTVVQFQQNAAYDKSHVYGDHQQRDVSEIVNVKMIEFISDILKITFV